MRTGRHRAITAHALGLKQAECFSGLFAGAFFELPDLGHVGSDSLAVLAFARYIPTLRFRNVVILCHVKLLKFVASLSLKNIQKKATGVMRVYQDGGAKGI